MIVMKREREIKRERCNKQVTVTVTNSVRRY
jgi:hypothetical protein